MPAAPVPRSEWDAFAASHAAAHLLQTSRWGDLKQGFGWDREWVVLRNGRGEIQAGAQVLFRRAAGLTLAYVPKGPLVNWHDGEEVRALLSAIQASSRRRGAAVLKIEPELVDSVACRAQLAHLGFRPSQQTVQPRSTLVLPIAEDEDAILGRMKSKWRYNIRLAERKEVRVRAAQPADLAQFHALMATTGRRDGFAVHTPAYFDAAYRLLAPDQAVFLLAEHRGQVLAAIVVAACSDTAWYLWGASGDHERNRMPNHALQWAGMRWAKGRGATRYDLWGIPDDIGRVACGLRHGTGQGVSADELPIDLDWLPEGELWGVYRFKQGFGGEIVRTVGAWDLPLHDTGYRLYQLGLDLRAATAKAPDRIRRAAASLGVLQAIPAATAGPWRVTAEEDAQQWRALLAHLPDPHVLQSWEWGELKVQTGWSAERVVLTAGDGTVKAAFQLLIRQPVDRAPLRVAYVPKGPAVDWRDLHAVDAVLDAVERRAVARGCVFVKIDPDVRTDTATGVALQARLRRRGWVFSPEQVQFQNTAYSDLTVGEGALLAAMKSKWRYNIRLAERRGVTVRLGVAGDLPAFYRLYAETGARDGFLTRPFPYYARTWSAFMAAEEDTHNPAGGALLLAEHADEAEPVAGLFLMRYGARAWYFYGASSERRRRDMPNHLLQWEALRWSLARGCTVYDWWGAPTHPADEQDRLHGVWLFKQGFGAELQPHVGAWDYAVSQPAYRLYTQAMPRILDLMRRRHGAG